MRLRLLIIDSDEIMCQYLTGLFTECGYECTCVNTGLQALAILEQCAYNLIIMDHKLPDIGGFHLLRQIHILNNAQIMILSAEDSEYNRVRALEEGATDFIAKPLTYPAEFLWRVRAILKRAIKQQIILSRVQINLMDKSVNCDGIEVTLSPQVFLFLVALASNPGQVVTHDQLLYFLDGDFCATSNNILYVLVNRLRECMEHDFQKPKLINTVRGVGYMLNDH